MNDRETSRRVVVTRRGGPEVLQVVEENAPRPGPGEARVRVLVAGVSGFDLLYRRWGRIMGAPRGPFGLGEDIVGVVDELGDGATSVAVGQMVAAATWAPGVGGGYAEHICLPEAELVPVPDGVDPAAAVCMVVNYLTAHLHLHHFGTAQPGELLLVHGAAGGVGTALLQLAANAHLEVFGTASERDRTTIEVLGATPIDYQSEDFVQRIADLTPDGVDLVVDTVGGAQHLWQSYRTLRSGGRLVWLGSAAAHSQGFRVGLLSTGMSVLLKVIPDRKRVPMCPTVGKFSLAHNEWYRDTLTELLDGVATGRLDPLVAERLPLDEAARAHEILEAGTHAGKIVLVTDATG